MNPIVHVAVLAVAFATRLSAQETTKLDEEAAGRFAALALACVHKEYPNKISHSLNSPADVKAPHELTPAFYGCYDWHSSVHGHWLLARLVRAFPRASFAPAAMKALATSITASHIAGEVSYLNAPGRETFERPYGLAWLLQLSAELHESPNAEAKALAGTLQPLEAAVATRLRRGCRSSRIPSGKGSIRRPPSRSA